MSRHELHSRGEREVLWFQRRDFLRAAAAWSALCGAGASQSQQPGSVVARQGDILVNGRPLDSQQGVRPGDTIETGPGSTLTAVIGDSALHIRQNSRLAIAPGNTSMTIGVLRLITGAVVSVWGKDTPRQIITPTLVAGIRGTGTYVEVPPGQNGRTYFCTCYGSVELSSGLQIRLAEAEYHEAFWTEVNPGAGRYLIPALLINHTDEEVEQLAQLVNQRTTWQITGRKENRDPTIPRY